ncbi:hypothetical protein BGZ47_000542 [Haplosporangium gracile]|nr:hypothetical protein BGZ47_000542 [Haplosporangium gracile]
MFSAAKVEGPRKKIRKYCPNNFYISMIVAYPTKWTDKLPAPSELPMDSSGVQQVVINISDDNFDDIFSPRSMWSLLIDSRMFESALLTTMTATMRTAPKGRELSLSHTASSAYMTLE